MALFGEGELVRKVGFYTSRFVLRHLPALASPHLPNFVIPDLERPVMVAHCCRPTSKGERTHFITTAQIKNVIFFSSRYLELADQWFVRFALPLGR